MKKNISDLRGERKRHGGEYRGNARFSQALFWTAYLKKLVVNITFVFGCFGLSACLHTTHPQYERYRKSHLSPISEPALAL